MDLYLLFVLTIMALTGYTRSQVAEHNTTHSLWIIIHGKVYNVTTFYQTHPGGDDIILNNAGKDATAAFDKAGHSEDAHDYMLDYVIGKVLEDD